MFILDTDHLTFLQRKDSAEHHALSERMRIYPLEKFHVTIVSFHEQVNGWNNLLQRSQLPHAIVRAYSMFEELLSDYTRLNVLSFDINAAAIFTDMRRNGVRVGTMDLRIAAIALDNGFTVLTRNVIDFGKVPGLDTEDWTTPDRRG